MTSTNARSTPGPAPAAGQPWLLPALDPAREAAKARDAEAMDRIFRDQPAPARPVLATERVAVYCRISDDPRKKEEGVARQAEDGTALCKSRGWELAGVWTDNDVAVLRPGAPRPQYDALMDAVARGEVTRIVAYGLARMFRNRRDRAEAIEFLARHRVSITLVKGGELDLTSAAGRAVAGLLGEMDTMESELKSERVARAALGRAEQGRANGHVAYGWERVYVRDATGVVQSWQDVEHPEQAAVVREIVARLLANETLRSVANRLNARGVAPPRRALRVANGRPDVPARRVAHEWQPGTVRKVATRAANVGIRERGRQSFALAAWPAIVDRAQHDQVVALLTAPSRRTCKDGARRHLLTYGIGTCGVCGGVLRVHTVRRRKATHADQVLYQCAAQGCVGRNAARVDALLLNVVVRRLARDDAADLLSRDDAGAAEARERAAHARARLARTQDDYDDDVIDRDQYLRSTRRWRAVLAEADEDAMRGVQGVDSALVRRLAGPGAREEWEGMDVAQRRALLDAMGCVVTIHKQRPGPGFDPASVGVTFRGEGDTVAA